MPHPLWQGDGNLRGDGGLSGGHGGEGGISFLAQGRALESFIFYISFLFFKLKKILLEYS